MNNKQHYAFDSINFLLLAIGFITVVIGFVLMTGSSSTEHHFDASIFSSRRTFVAPLVSFLGFIFMIYAVIRKSHITGGDIETNDNEHSLEA